MAIRACIYQEVYNGRSSFNFATKILESYEASKAYEANKDAEYRKAYEAERAADELQQAKLKVLQDTLGSYGDLSYVDWDDFIDPDNQNWADYTYRLPSFMVSPTESAKDMDI